MRIASIIDISLVDVPRIPVTVIFTGGCNFDCPYCQNASLIPRSSGEELSHDDIIAKMDDFLSDGFCITGGEPTIQNDLPDFLGALRKRIGGHINLNTQGSIPTTLKRSLPFLDSVWFDIKASPSHYQVVSRTKHDPWPYIRESIDLVLRADAEFWPRTTYVGNLLSPQDLVDILEFLEGVGFDGTYTIQNYVQSAGVRPDETSHLVELDMSDAVDAVESFAPSFDISFMWR